MDVCTSVVVAARNAGCTLGAQLVALTDSCDSCCEIIVVDNMSTDDTAAVARRFPVRVLECRTLGLGAARNVGVRGARGAKILCCDADDVVSARWIRTMSECLDTYDIVGGPLDWTTLNDPAIQRTRKNLFDNRLPVNRDAYQPIGANIGFRRTVFEALNGFDEAFVQAGDDLDFVERARVRGCTIGFAAAAVVSYRLRDSVRDAARQAAVYTLATAQFRAKNAIAQPWKSKVLRAMQHIGMVLSVWRCLTRSGRLAYAAGIASARAAVVGYRRYRVVA